MPCRVGITTNLARRKSEWESQVIGLKDWSTKGPYNREEAQKLEDQIAARYGCNAHHGGADASSNRWYVYWFNYTRTK